MTLMAGATDARTLLNGLHMQLSTEHDEASAEVATIVGAADRAGDDDIDASSKVAQREHYLTLLASIRARREQVEHALRRLEEGTYGRCEHCNAAIDPARLEAFPAATSCVGCKRR
jgi:DnaK suppressor protein